MPSLFLMTLRTLYRYGGSLTRPVTSCIANRRIFIEPARLNESPTVGAATSRPKPWIFANIWLNGAASNNAQFIPPLCSGYVRAEDRKSVV